MGRQCQRVDRPRLWRATKDSSRLGQMERAVHAAMRSSKMLLRPTKLRDRRTDANSRSFIAFWFAGAKIPNQLGFIVL